MSQPQYELYYSIVTNPVAANTMYTKNISTLNEISLIFQTFSLALRNQTWKIYEPEENTTSI